MKNELEKWKGLISFLVGRRPCRGVSKVFRKQQALAVLSFVLMVLLGTVSAQESIEHGYLTNATYHPEVPRISGFETKKLFDEGKLLLINCMEALNYSKDHITGSLSLEELERRGTDFPEDLILAFYCN